MFQSLVQIFVLLSIYILRVVVCFVFFFKQKTAYEMRISDWSSDVCSSDLGQHGIGLGGRGAPAANRDRAPFRRRLVAAEHRHRELQFGGRAGALAQPRDEAPADRFGVGRLGIDRRRLDARSEAHTSDLQSLIRISYAVFCMTTKTNLI